MGSITKINRYYLFSGSEEYTKWGKVKDLINLVVAKGYEDFDCNFYQGRGLDVATLINTACSPPIASKLRVVVLRDLDKVPVKGQELLEKFISRIPEYTTLVMTAEKVDARKKLFKKILTDKEAHRVFNEPTPQKAVDSVLEYAKSLEADITPEAAAYLVETVGCSPGRLEQEVAKLALFAGVGKPIQKADIAEMCGAGLSGTISDLPERIVSGDITGALVLLHHLLLAKESEGSILYRLKEYFLRLNAIKLYSASPDLVIRMFGLTAKDRKSAEILSRFAQKTSNIAITDCLHLVYDSEIALKSAGLGKDIILFALINRLGLRLRRE